MSDPAVGDFVRLISPRVYTGAVGQVKKILPGASPAEPTRYHIRVQLTTGQQTTRYFYRDEFEYEPSHQ